MKRLFVSFSRLALSLAVAGSLVLVGSPVSAAAKAKAKPVAKKAVVVTKKVVTKKVIVKKVVSKKVVAQKTPAKKVVMPKPEPVVAHPPAYPNGATQDNDASL